MAKLPPRKVGLLDDQQPESFVRRDADIQISVVNDLVTSDEKPPIPGYAPLDAVDDHIAARAGAIVQGNLLANDHSAEKPVIHIDDPKPQIVSFEYQGKVYNFADINQFAPGPKSILIETSAGNLTVSDNGEYRFEAANVNFFREGGFLNDKLTYTIEQGSQKDTAVIDLVVGGKIIPGYDPVDAVDDFVLVKAGSQTIGNLLDNDRAKEMPVIHVDDPAMKLVKLEYDGKVYEFDNKLKMPEGPFGKFVIVDLPNGSVKVYESGRYEFNTNKQGAVFEAEIKYTIESHGSQDTATLRIGVDGHDLPITIDKPPITGYAPLDAIDDKIAARPGEMVKGNLIANDHPADKPVIHIDDPKPKIVAFEYQGQTYVFGNLKILSGEHGKFLPIDTAAGRLTVHEDGYYTFEANNVNFLREGGFLNDKLTYTIEENGQRDTATIDISVSGPSPLPTKTEAHNDTIEVPSFIIGGAYSENTTISRPPVTGNILANDTLESGAKLASLNYEGKMYSFDRPSGADAGGKFVLIDTAHGMFKIYQSGSYTYAVDEGYREAGSEHIEYVLSGPNNGSRGEITIDIGAVIYGMGTIGPDTDDKDLISDDIRQYVTMAHSGIEDGGDEREFLTMAPAGMEDGSDDRIDLTMAAGGAEASTFDENGGGDELVDLTMAAGGAEASTFDENGGGDELVDLTMAAGGAEASTFDENGGGDELVDLTMAAGGAEASTFDENGGGDELIDLTMAAGGAEASTFDENGGGDELVDLTMAAGGAEASTFDENGGGDELLSGFAGEENVGLDEYMTHPPDVALGLGSVSINYGGSELILLQPEGEPCLTKLDPSDVPLVLGGSELINLQLEGEPCLTKLDPADVPLILGSINNVSLAIHDVLPEHNSLDSLLPESAPKVESISSINTISAEPVVNISLDVHLLNDILNHKDDTSTT